MDTRLAAGLLGGSVGLAYATAGALVAASSRGRPLMRAFAAFWLGLGGYALVEAAWALLAAVGVAPFWLALAVLHAKILAIVVGFGGLVAYLAGVYWGNARVVRVVLAAYALLWAFTEGVYALRNPVGQHAVDWGMRLDYARPGVEPWWTIMLASLMLPPLAAAVAYARLWRYSDDRAQRRRILATAGSLVLLLAPNLVAWRTGSLPWWFLAEKALGLAAGLGMVATAWAARREDDGRLAAGRRAGALADAEKLRQRISELV